MRIVIQALLASALIHAVYFLMTFAVDYAKTVLYQPTIIRGWEQTEMLQQETAFGMAISPLFPLSTFIGLALVCGIFLLGYQRMAESANCPEKK